MEIVQDNPASLLLPLTELPMEAPERVYCKWINTLGSRKGEECGRICCFESGFCSTHNLLTLKRAKALEKIEEPIIETIVEPIIETKVETIIEPIIETIIEPIIETKVEPIIETIKVEEPIIEEVLVEKPQVNVHIPETNSERLKKLEIIEGMIKLLQIVFSQ